MTSYCIRCGKDFTKKNRSEYSYLCKKCVKALYKKIATGKIKFHRVFHLKGGKKVHYTPEQMREIVLWENADDAAHGRWNKHPTP